MEIDIINNNEDKYDHGTFPCKTALINNIPDKNTTMKKSRSKKTKRDCVAIEPKEKDNNGEMNTDSNNGNSNSLS